MDRISEHRAPATSAAWPWLPAARRLLTHPLGGAVLSDTSQAGVVDHRGAVWGHPGLYVADSSGIPTELAVNPSLTIAAIAERLAYCFVRGIEAD